MRSGAVLIVPECERGRGGGHLGRSLFLFQELRERGRDAYLWIPSHLKDDVTLRFEEFFEAVNESGASAPGGEKETRGRILSRREEVSGKEWDFIVLDRFRTPPEEFFFWYRLAPLIGIDEGGTRRKRFDFLIDILPSLNGRAKGAMAPNVTAPALLPLPRNRRPRVDGAPQDGNAVFGKNEGPLRVLISFGAEDSRGLGVAAARVLAREQMPLPEITLIAPVPPEDDSDAELFRRGGVRVIGKIPKLREHLAEYDLLITHFGLGAFEAVYVRLPVLLVSPTAYHEKLSRNVGFFSLGIGAKGIRRLRKIDFASGGAYGRGGLLEEIKRRGEKIARCFDLENTQQKDLGSYMHRLVPRAPRRCPVCGEKTDGGNVPVLARSLEKTYRRCPVCGVIYLARLTPPPIEYEKEYFFGFYKKQYGKTYLEDFPNLKEMGRKRLEHICSLLNFTRSRRDSELACASNGVSSFSAPLLLDIGCAYGPFLAAAAERGFSPAGIDPAEDAVRYVKEELKFPALRGFFPAALRAARPAETLSRPSGEDALNSVKFDAGSFSAVTLWYVIEHFEEPGKIFREINRLLKDGGVLAFSTPSFSGISGRKSLGAFLEKSPPDHWTVLRPGVCKNIFRQYGFRLEKIVVRGHHPERFPLLGRFVNPAKKGVLYRLLLRASRIFRLGDTFEAYGVKTRNCFP